MRPTLDQWARVLLPHVAKGRFFSPLDRRVFHAAAEVLLEGCPVEITPQEVVQVIEDFLILGRSRRAWRIRVLAVIVEFAPLILLGRGRFSKLSLIERRRLIEEKFIHGRYIWSICSKIKQLVYLGVYGDPRAERAVGFQPWHERSRYQVGLPPKFMERASGQSPDTPEGVSL